MFHNTPHIGILCARLQFGPDMLEKVATSYVEAIVKANGLPFLLPNLADHMSQYLAEMDGILLIGGANDIDPNCFGEKNTASLECMIAKDEMEIQLIHDCIRLEKPVLGICRGMQIMNVALGGTLFQDLVSTLLHNQPDRQHERIHAVHILGSAVLPDGTIIVNSIHHQAVDVLGEDLRITGRAEDGAIEVLEHKKAPMIGVEWHPECLPDSDETNILFRWLVNTSKLQWRNHRR